MKDRAITIFKRHKNKIILIIIFALLFFYDLWGNFYIDKKNIDVDYMKKTLQWLYYLYCNINKSSLKSAASFCAMFAIVIAMIQAIYPYRLGKILDYPISKLDETPFKEISIKRLGVCALTIITAELTGFYAFEVGVVVLGYIIIVYWLYKIVQLYRQYEDVSGLMIKKIKEDLNSILRECGESKKNAEEDLKVIFEHITNTDGMEEREVLKYVINTLSNKDNYQIIRMRLDPEEYCCILEYSFYLSNQIMNKCIKVEPVGHLWHYRLLKAALSTVEYNAESGGEYFVKGILFGILAGNGNKLITNNTIDDILIIFYDKLEIEQLGELIGCLCVFVELYCNEQENALNTAEMLLNSDYIDIMCYPSIERLIAKMEESYCYLINLFFEDAILKYDVVEALVNELVLKKRNKIPVTILGGLYAFKCKM